MSDKLEVQKCHHCGHEWEPRVKKPKKCPQCQNPLWKSENPKKPKVKTRPVVEVAPTPIAVSEEAPPTPPTTDTNTEDIQPAVSGVVEPPPEPEPLVSRLQREAEERMRRLVNQPI
jgi:uncharacterized OB-fold protein